MRSDADPREWLDIALQCQRPMQQDYFKLAQGSSRDSFVSAFQHPFLVGEGVLHQPRPGRTMTFESGDTVAVDAQTIGRSELQLAFGVRKTNSTFPSMITVGRTRNNDVVIADVLISKFHAFFRIVGQHHELADAGSQNGTRVGERLLEPKGPALRVRYGDVIHFAQLRFAFLDAGAAWDALRAR